MAADYTTGSAASLADLRTAVENFLVTFCGWAAVAGTGNNRLLSKGDLYVRIGYDANRFYVYGGTGISGTALVNESPRGANLGNTTAQPWAFPVNYEIYWNDTPEEIYIVVNYNGDKYQHLHWGESDIPDIGGTGLWFEGSYSTNSNMASGNAPRMYMGVSRNGSGQGNFGANPYDSSVVGGYFTVGESAAWTRPGGIHCALEGAAAWRMGNSTTVGDLRGQYQSAPLIMAMPSMFNESEVLLPIYIVMRRVDSVDTIVGVLRHARLMRVDNVAVGDIITYGADQWKCYPLYSKNVAERNGVPWATGGFHSGTFGVALRYPGV